MQKVAVSGNNRKNLLRVVIKIELRSPYTLGRMGMLRTIILGSCVSVQGTYIRTFSDGRILVRVGSREFAGKPTEQQAA